MAAFRYWRIVFNTDLGNNGSCGELEMRSTSGGPDQCVGGVASASSVYGGTYVAAWAFDNNPNTMWVSNATANGGPWIQYDFGAGNPKDIVEIVWRGRADGFSYENPSWLHVKASNDGVVWEDVWRVTNITGWTPTGGGQKTFTRDIDLFTEKFKPHRYWRLWLLTHESSTDYSLAEVALRSTPGGTNLLLGGTATASSTVEGTPAQAIDGDPATYWAGGGTGASYWSCALPTNISPTQLDIRSRNDGWGPGQAPRTFQLLWSDNNTDWYFRDSYSTSAWSQGQEKSFALSQAPVQVVPPVPTVTRQFDSIVVTWPAVPGATSYDLWWKTDNINVVTTGTKETGVTSGWTKGTSLPLYLVVAANGPGGPAYSAVVPAYPVLAHTVSGYAQGVLGGIMHHFTPNTQTSYEPITYDLHYSTSGPATTDSPKIANFIPHVYNVEQTYFHAISGSVSYLITATEAGVTRPAAGAYGTSPLPPAPELTVTREGDVHTVTWALSPDAVNDYHLYWDTDADFDRTTYLGRLRWVRSPQTVTDAGQLWFRAEGVGEHLIGALSAATTVESLPPPEPTVDLKVESFRVPVGGTQQLSLLVQNATDPACTYSVSPPEGGTVSPEGLFTAGSTPGTYTITATLNENGAISDSVSVTVEALPPEPPAPVPSLDLKAETLRVPVGSTQALALATRNVADAAVVYTVEPPEGGTVSAEGVFTAGSVPGSYVITATLIEDDTLSDSVTVIVEAAAEVPEVLVGAVPVDILIKDSQVVPMPVDGVMVGIYHPDTYALEGSGLSDLEGRASFSLPGSEEGVLYEVRFYKRGALFQNPGTIQVLAPSLAVQVFETSCVVPDELPVSGDPYLCRCTGRFLRLDGSPMRNVGVWVTAALETLERAPKVLGEGDSTAFVASSGLERRTDAQGMVSIDLPRGGRFGLVFTGEDDVVWPIQVPDAPNANLVELVHPVPVQLEWDPLLAPDNQVSVPVGGELLLPFRVRFSDGTYKTERLSELLEFEYTNASRLVVRVRGDGQVSITGVAGGPSLVTASIQPSGLYPQRYPVPALSAPTLSVSIST